MTAIPKMTPVESSNIKAMGWNNGNMYIQYKNDSVYIFEGVSEMVYNSILNSPSVGKAVHALDIKGKLL